jgi:hypothetical protein
MQQDSQDTPATDQPSLSEFVLQLASGQVVIMDGSLANQCAAALTELYGKDSDENQHLVAESYEEDLHTTMGVWEALRQHGLLDQFTNKDQMVNYLYALREGDVQLSDAIRFVDALQVMTDDQLSGAALLLEPQNTVAHPVLVANVRSAAARYGVPVYDSIQGYSLALGARTAP